MQISRFGLSTGFVFLVLLPSLLIGSEASN